MNSQKALITRSRFSESNYGAVTTDPRNPATNAGCGQKKLLTFLIGSILASGSIAAHAIDAKVSGQLSRALMNVDDGRVTETHNVDNDISSTRFRFTGSGEMMPGVKAGINFEAEFQSNPSDLVTQAVPTISPTLDERVMEVYFQGGFGTVSLGQGSGAADGDIEVDLSGTTIAQWSGVHGIGGAISFLNSSTGAAVASITSVINNQDFESRYDRLRYDTPSFGGFRFAASTGVSANQDVKELAVTYSGDLGAGGKVAGAFGFSAQDTATAGFNQEETVGGSVSWLLNNGLNFTYATSENDRTATRKGKFSYLKVGYKTGNHAVSFDLAEEKDRAATGDKADQSGVAYVYTPAKWAEIYAAYKTHGLDRPGTPTDDIKILLVGSRLKF